MTPDRRYIVDSNVFITAKNLYYAFDICPGFWKGIIRHHQQGRVHSVDRVRTELLAGRETEDLVKWVKNDLPAGFFLDTNSGDVSSLYGRIMLWVQRNPQFFDNAKAQFAAGADGWLVAFAKVHGAIVVTTEQPSPDAKSRVPLPNVCEEFGVTYTNTFSMLRELNVQLVLGGAN
ncbi:MAG TPA: DUF4411 family protein [Planctomycetota bacterium]|nr:DUF4411 family protein [Planctomycetota bacterium]